MFRVLLLLAASVTPGHGHPGYLRQCWAKDGASVMNQRSVEESSDCTLMVPSGMTQYVPGRSYSFTVNGPSDRKAMLGSSGGSWSDAPSGTTACDANNELGLWTNGYLRGQLTATWTAPGTPPDAQGGRIVIGATCGKYSAVHTASVTLAPQLPPGCSSSDIQFSSPATGCGVETPPAEVASGAVCAVTCPVGQHPNRILGCFDGNWNGSEVACIEYDACARHPCPNQGEICTDIAAAQRGALNARGRTCSCPAGQEVADNANSCTDINACRDNPCSGDGVRCIDLVGQPNNGAGRRCACEAGLAEDANGNCQEVDACVENPCPGGNVDCSDVQAPAPNSAGGRICACQPGYRMGAVECENIDACEGNPCLTGGSADPDRCADTVSSDPRARICASCPSGYVPSSDGGSANCVDQDFCATDPNAQSSCANRNRACFDRAAPAIGYDCDNPICADSTEAGAEPASCDVCDDGFQPNQRRSECVSCPLGSGGRGGVCIACPNGQESTADGTGCVDCPAGTVRTQGREATCTACPESFYTEDSATCLPCTGPGLNVVENECVPCLVTEIGRNGVCQACPAGLVRLNAGQCGPATTTTTVPATTTMAPITADNFCAQFEDVCGTSWDTSADGVTCAAGSGAMIPGRGGDRSGNTLACRIYHLGAARADAPPGRSAHCAHASRSGARMCVGAVVAEDFCPHFVNVCSAAGAAGSWDTESSCLAGTRRMLVGEPGSTPGDNLACRTYHLGVAASSSADEDIARHCGHASASGADVCVGRPSPTDFCLDYMSVCPGTSWANVTACIGDAAALITGASRSTTRDTLNCRIYHLGLARTDSDVHCSHAGRTGDGQCVGLPSGPEFCEQFRFTCPDTTWGSCEDDFAGFQAGNVGDTGGDTQACRAYHLTAAMGDPATHCSHASQSGGSVCGTGLVSGLPPSAPAPTASPSTAEEGAVSAAAASGAGTTATNVYSKSDAITLYLLAFIIVFVAAEYTLFVKSSHKIMSSGAESSSDDGPKFSGNDVSNPGYLDIAVSAETADGGPDPGAEEEKFGFG